MFLRFIHVVPWISISCHFIAEWYSECMHQFYLFVHQLMDTWTLLLLPSISQRKVDISYSCLWIHHIVSGPRQIARLACQMLLTKRTGPVLVQGFMRFLHQIKESERDPAIFKVWLCCFPYGFRFRALSFNWTSSFLEIHLRKGPGWHWNKKPTRQLKPWGAHRL